jgi:glycosyltransferase involved in cell wall biosynthesis
MQNRILFFWTTYSGYMASCWRALADLGVDLHIVCFRPTSGNSEPLFKDSVLNGLSATVLNWGEPNLRAKLDSSINQFKPDVLAIAGWGLTDFYDIMLARQHASLPIVLCMDNQYRGDTRQFLGKIRLSKLFKRVSRVAVTGDRSWTLAKYFGAPEERIFKGVYGVDFANLSTAYAQRISQKWPRSFVFTGRYEQRKGLDILLKAYNDYRVQVEDPWQLKTIGNGPLKASLQSVSGVEDLGFKEPYLLPSIFSDCGAFVLPSRFDAWPLSLVEAAAAGLPIIATNACGSTVEIVRDGFNGFLVTTDSSQSLTNCLLEAHRKYDLMPTYGKRAMDFAEPWSACHWAVRWQTVIKELLNSCT